MVRSLELMSHEERLREMGMFNLARRRLRCHLTAAHKYLKGRAKLFSIVTETNSKCLPALCCSCTYLPSPGQTSDLWYCLVSGPAFSPGFLDGPWSHFIT